jgi:enoyl-CoA hydratase/carnithine racemase
VTAERAESIGLATQVVDDDELHGTAQALARRLADGPALAYSTTKVMLTRELDMSLGSAIEMEALTQALLMQTGDHREFYAAWTEGRQPAWSGR